MMKTMTSFILLLTAPLAALAPRQIERIDEATKKYAVEEKGGGVGVIIVYPGPNGYEIKEFSHGHVAGPQSPPPRNNSIFLLASVSKVFCTTLLAKFVEEGRCRLDDLAQQYVPSWVHVPSFEGKQITLEHLATHTSGLPSEAPGSGKKAYHYTKQDFYRALSHIHLHYAPGTKDVYSNMGIGFLGLILGNIAGRPYEEILVENILNPLNMPDTRYTYSLTPAQKERMVHFFINGKRVKTNCCKAMPAIGAGGGLTSTMHDMTQFLLYNMGLLNTELNSLLPILQKHYFRMHPRAFQCLAWYHNPLYPKGKLMKFSKNGGMPGVSTYIAFVKESKTGVIVLANAKSHSTKLGNDILKIMNPHEPAHRKR